MKLDIPLPENWEQLNDSLKEKLSLHASSQVRTFKDLSSAVLEIAQGTAQFLSHKKSVGFIKGQTPAYEFLLPHFYKEAFQISNSSYLDLKDPQAWVEGLPKDTSFVLFAEDHPVTGEIYDFTDELDRCLSEKRIFSIRISHSLHFIEKTTEIRPYSVRICSFTDGLAVAILGERFRSPTMFVSRQPWNGPAVENEWLKAQAAHDGKRDSRELILNFETALAPLAQVWFKPEARRVWDRSIVVFPDVSGQALAEKIFAVWKVNREQGWEKIDTTNLCRWGSVRAYQSWWEPLPTAETLRGLLIFSLEALQTKDFAKLVLSSYEEIKQMQSWS